ncbi:hypothetical protein NDU88_002743 [Pleurodeles waltl]|uniref:Uncharacterized protein n=1 Tax=Pleurodeles waltl TaxID=8319 RepID=A0AAV7UE19_PLEWA|nr:hypothetical protein NDU88_002743 [Pleurodeles waltl]
MNRGLAPEELQMNQIDGGGTSQEPGIGTMFLDFKQTPTAIETKIDLLTDRFDHLKEKVDTHDVHIDHLERHTLDMEDGQHSAGEKLLQMKKVLDVIYHISLPHPLRATPCKAEWLRDTAYCQEQLSLYWDVMPVRSRPKDIWSHLELYMKAQVTESGDVATMAEGPRSDGMAP